MQRGGVSVSKSFIYTLNKNYVTHEIHGFDNSWLFSPMVWRRLCAEYLPKERLGDKMIPASFMGLNGVENWQKINDIMNHSDNHKLRIVWEMTNQQFFLTKDKFVIADAVESFLTIFPTDDEGFAWGEHIVQRFKDMADRIRSIDENVCPYCVHKNSSCDDSIERHLQRFDEKKWTSVPVSLRKTAHDVQQEFVIIEDNKIVNFISCKDFIK